MIKKRNLKSKRKIVNRKNYKYSKRQIKKRKKTKKVNTKTKNISKKKNIGKRTVRKHKFKYNGVGGSALHTRRLRVREEPNMIRLPQSSSVYNSDFDSDFESDSDSDSEPEIVSEIVSEIDSESESESEPESPSSLDSVVDDQKLKNLTTCITQLKTYLSDTSGRLDDIIYQRFKLDSFLIDNFEFNNSNNSSISNIVLDNLLQQLDMFNPSTVPPPVADVAITTKYKVFTVAVDGVVDMLAAVESIYTIKVSFVDALIDKYNIFIDIFSKYLTDYLKYIKLLFRKRGIHKILVFFTLQEICNILIDLATHISGTAETQTKEATTHRLYNLITLLEISGPTDYFSFLLNPLLKTKLEKVLGILKIPEDTAIEKEFLHYLIYLLFNDSDIGISIERVFDEKLCNNIQKKQGQHRCQFVTMDWVLVDEVLNNTIKIRGDPNNSITHTFRYNRNSSLYDKISDDKISDEYDTVTDTSPANPNDAYNPFLESSFNELANFSPMNNEMITSNDTRYDKDIYLKGKIFDEIPVELKIIIKLIETKLIDGVITQPEQQEIKQPLNRLVEKVIKLFNDIDHTVIFDTFPTFITDTENLDIVKAGLNKIERRRIIVLNDLIFKLSNRLKKMEISIIVFFICLINMCVDAISINPVAYLNNTKSILEKLRKTTSLLFPETKPETTPKSVTALFFSDLFVN